jgi:hypothetical protein
MWPHVIWKNKGKLLWLSNLWSQPNEKMSLVSHGCGVFIKVIRFWTTLNNGGGNPNCTKISQGLI